MASSQGSKAILGQFVEEKRLPCSASLSQTARELEPGIEKDQTPLNIAVTIEQ